MTYTSSIPESGETLGGTRARINTNFQQIDSVESVNHVAFNESGEGKHKFLQMPEQAAAPTTAANEGAVYTKQASDGTTQLFYREESNGDEIQMTGGTVAAEGSITLPGGLILKWGKKTTAGTSGTITFATAFPTQVLSITLGMIRNNSSSTQAIYVNSAAAIGPASFNYTNTSSNTDFFWQAIGN